LARFFFGIGHIYQGNAFVETLGFFSITAMGAVWFAWLYIEWNANLWVPIFLHLLMNLSWALFDIGNNALGDLAANLFRNITITLTIVITIYSHREKGLKIRKNVLFKNDNSLRSGE
jgi:uncharacterized protein